MSLTQSPGLFSNKQTETDGTSLFIRWGEKKKVQLLPHSASHFLPGRRALCSFCPIVGVDGKTTGRPCVGQGRREAEPWACTPRHWAPWRNTAFGPTSRILHVLSRASPGIQVSKKKKKKQTCKQTNKQKALPTSAPHHFLYKRKERRHLTTEKLENV